MSTSDWDESSVGDEGTGGAGGQGNDALTGGDEETIGGAAPEDEKEGA